MAIKHEEEEAGIPEWVVTFGDMMSLLLTFFIMLFSMSEIKEEQRYQAMVEALRRRFGHELSSLALVPGTARPRNSDLAKLAAMGRARRANTMNGGDKVKAPVGEHPRVRQIRKGEESTVGGVVFFAYGTADLTEQDKRLLQATALEIGGKPTKIEIRGHTSTRPLSPNSPYKDHWELAYARCANVRDFLVKLGINPKRLRIAVAGDNEPMHLGTDPLEQKKNDRVNISMLNEWISDRKGADDERQKLFAPESDP